MTNNAVRTNIFRVASSTYVKTIILILLQRYWWIPTVPIAALVIAGCTVDDVYLYLALILFTVSYPAILLLVYSRHALTLEARAEVMPHAVTISENGLAVERFCIQTDDDDQETYIPESTDDVPAHKIAEISFGRDSIVVRVKGRRLGVMIIPEKAIPENHRRQAYMTAYQLSERI